MFDNSENENILGLNYGEKFAFNLNSTIQKTKLLLGSNFMIRRKNKVGQPVMPMKVLSK